MMAKTGLIQALKDDFGDALRLYFMPIIAVVREFRHALAETSVHHRSSADLIAKDMP